jgi:hypothetical protein
LITVIAEATRKPRPTVFAIDRELATAGLRKIGGRGTSAAKMTPRDAAQLLTAVMGSEQIRDAASVVKFYTDTRLHEGSKDAPYASVLIPELRDLPPNHSFIDALAALLTAVESGSIAALPIMKKSRSLVSLVYSIFVTYPSRMSGIQLFGDDWKPATVTGDVQYALPWPDDEGDGRKKFFAAMHRKYPTSKRDEEGGLRGTWILDGSVGGARDPISKIGKLFKA